MQEFLGQNAPLMRLHLDRTYRLLYAVRMYCIRGSFMRQASFLTFLLFIGLLGAFPVAAQDSETLPPPPPQAFSNEDLVKAAAEAAAASAEQQKDVGRKSKAFESASDGFLPMSSDQIREFMRRLESAQSASIPPVFGQPKGEVQVQTVSLDPGVEPPQIDVAAGYVTTLTILDASGQPWPIADVGVGGNFDVPSPPPGSHILRITPLMRVGFGNLSIRLQDLSTPITFRIAAGGPVVHYRYDARIPKFGPSAKPSLIDKGGPKLTAGDPMIMAILENAPPKDSKRFKVSGVDTRTSAFGIGEKVFVRTPLTLLSPSWDASVSSADGMTVYEIGQTPVLLLSDGGVMVRAKVIQDKSDDE
jgi:intracellular multiplication protein IcmK